jgi:hypothetical protein
MMGSIHVLAVTITLILYAILAIAYFGWGKATTNLLGLEKQKNRSVTPLIWIGWAFTLLIFQLFHFALPLTAFVVVPILMVGIGLAIPSIVSVYRRHTIQISILTLLRWLGIIAVSLAGSGWVASRSMLHPANYDSGLYHFNKIRWINSFPIVPGLGNLHGRLAFNQSFFTYVAALNFYPFFGHGRSIANSFLFLLTIATFIDLLRPVFKRPSLLIASHPFQYTSIVIAFPVLGYLALSSHGLAAPSPDLTSILLQLTMVIVLAQGIGEWKSGQTNQNDRAMFLGILAVTAVTTKLSSLLFSAVIMGFILLYARRPHAAHAIARVVALSVVMILVWCLQSVVLSGAPLYPSTIGYVPVDWAVPIEQVSEEANKILGWARQSGTYWSNVLGNWNWFAPWLLKISKETTDVVYPLTTSILFLVLTATIHRFKKGSRLQYLEWSILLPLIIGLIYWFFTAPDPRFADALFFALSICSVLLFFSSIYGMSNRRIFFVIICVVFVFSNLNFAEYFMENKETVKSISLSGWKPLRTVPLDRKVTSSGLIVYTPKKGDQCWDSPLPCTPYFNSSLRLRDPDRISSGFTVTGKGE